MSIRKVFFFILFLLFLSLVILLIIVSGDYEKTPKTLYINGNIITMDERQPNVESMLIEDGIITDIGISQILKDRLESKVSIVDLQGKTVLPGFIDPHTHAALSASMSQMIDLSGFTHDNNDEMWNHLRSEIEKIPKGDWVVGMGIDPILIPDLVTPHIEDLDELTTDHPVILFAQSLHTFWVNSNAFEKAGIIRDTPDPSDASYYERDENGNLTGIIAEQEAIRPIMTLLQEEYLTPKRFVQSALLELKKYAANGNTTIVSTGLTGANANMLKLYEHLSSTHPNKVNQILALFNILPKRQALPRHIIYLRHDNVDLLPTQPNYNSDGYRIQGIKHWYDGAPYTGSMYLNKPYKESELTNDLLHIPKGQRGKALIGKEELETFIRNYNSKGWQLSIHSQGDASNTELIEAFREIHKVSDIKDRRHRLEHCLLISDTHLSQMKDMNMTPSFHINHLLFYGDALKNNLIGSERAEKILPVGEAEELGIPYSLHADQPMFKSDPFRLMQTAIERQTSSGDTLGYGQRIELHEALRAMTIEAAWQIYMEDKIGSLAIGKYADFIIVDQDPYTVVTKDLENIKVLEAYVNGNRITTN